MNAPRMPGRAPIQDPHRDCAAEPSAVEMALERDLEALLARIQAERSSLRRHQMWRVYARKVRMRSDQQIRRMAMEHIHYGERA